VLTLSEVSDDFDQRCGWVVTIDGRAQTDLFVWHRIFLFVKNTNQRMSQVTYPGGETE